MFKNAIKPAFDRLLNIIYPPRCIACGVNVHENGNLCAACWGDINFISNPQCFICGFPFDFEAGEHQVCGSCIQEKPHFARARSVFIYDDFSSKIITSFKYGDELS